jgi:hypothetical protein
MNLAKIHVHFFKTTNFNPMRYSPYSFIIILVLSILTLGSCRKDKKVMVDATIQGYDSRMCACCGGIMISLPEGDDHYSWPHLTDGLPAHFPIDSATKFPVYVRIAWQPHPTAFESCKRIIVTDIESR